MPGQSFPYVLRGDRADSPPARFFVRALTAQEAIEQSDRIDKARGGTGMNMVTNIFDELRRVLVNWENLKGRDGLPIPFDSSKCESLLSIGEAEEITIAAMRGVAENTDPKNFDIYQLLILLTEVYAKQAGTYENVNKQANFCADHVAVLPDAAILEAQNQNPSISVALQRYANVMEDHAKAFRRLRAAITKRHAQVGGVDMGE